MRLYFRIIGLLGLWLLTLSIGLAAIHNNAPFSPWIAFESRDDIYRMRFDGSHLENLTQHPAIDKNPVWSPDKKWIAFESLRDGSGGIYRMRPNGTQVKDLTPHSYLDSSPNWSPDGQSILFLSDRDFKLDIYQMHFDGTQEEHLPFSEYYSQEIPLGWSLDGRWMLFLSDGASSEPHSYEVFRMHPDGTNIEPIVEYPPCSCSIAVSSPDEKWIALITVGVDYHLGFIQPDGSHLTIFQRLVMPYSHPVWSPDSQWLAYEDISDGNSKIYRVNVENSQLENLSQTPAVDSSPSWSPDGKWLAFVSYENQATEIYRMNADGSHRVQLTHNSVNDTNPVWSPLVDIPYTPWKPTLFALGLLAVAWGGMFWKQ